MQASPLPGSARAVPLQQPTAHRFDSFGARGGSTTMSETAESRVIEAEEIQRILPHRYPFLLVDRIIEIEPPRRAVGIKQVTANEPHFQGHFPSYPVMP